MKVMANSRGQGSIEFVILIAVLLFFFISVLAIVTQNITEKNVEKKRIILQGVAIQVRDEISFAVESTDGYIRNFEIPQKILGSDYNIFIYESRVYFGFDNNSLSSYKSFNITGNVQKGINKIRKEDGEIYLNE